MYWTDIVLGFELIFVSLKNDQTTCSFYYHYSFISLRKSEFSLLPLSNTRLSLSLTQTPLNLTQITMNLTCKLIFRLPMKF